MSIKIDKIIYYHIKMPLKFIFETSFGSFKYNDSIIVEFISNDYRGYGEIPVNEGPWYTYETVKTALHISLDFVSKLILNRLYNSIHDFISSMEMIRGHNMVKGGHEMAFLDLISKIENMPLHKYIGGVKESIESGISIGVINDIDELLRQIGYFLDFGFRRIKIKVKPGWDIKPIKIIRKEYGDVPLQVDANGSFLYDKHHDILLEMDNYDLIMIEQPLNYNDLYEHSLLQSELKTPICLDESIKNIYDAISAVKMDSCKIINIKPPRVGGMMESIKISEYCERNNIPVWIGGLLETGIGKSHLVAIATLSNVKYPSDISGSERYYEEDIIDPPITVKNGYIKVSDKPGIGVEVLEDKLLKYCLKKYCLTKKSKDI